MLRFIQNNLATIAVILIVAFMVFLAIRKIIKDKKAGVGACGHKCSECARSGRCEAQKDE